ncbi:MAG: hypothetical protein U1A78_33635 [Polyangia bacterium]
MQLPRRFNIQSIRTWSCWADCGPAFDSWPDAPQHRGELFKLFEEFGELRVRYAGLVVEQMAGSDLLYFSSLREAIVRRWLAPCAITTLIEATACEWQRMVPCPWFDDYLEALGCTEEQTRIVRDRVLQAGFRPRRFSVEAPDVKHSGLNVEAIFSPPAPHDPDPTQRFLRGDLQGDVLVAWTSYLFHGNEDPSLGPAWQRYQPNRRRDYLTYELMSD